MSSQVRITERLHSVNGVMEPQLVLIPTVDMLSDKIRAIEPGSERDLGDIREELAREHAVDITCPITTGKLLKVVAMLSHTAVTMGDPQAIPFWRAVRPDGPYGEKLAGGRGFIIAQRAKERAR
ncbi:hypothetical protein [Pelagibacterium luteolum]|uniref:Uncharacterized protein n=1 Tax=Pelagibacterium luteolum TaxID=440168 RepID=A0A1G7W3U9_9HYPH|nr:hypothetical protein [Pelagibacterium luteolum]SDG66682.1 hypothetical protein SAMN04487974_105200 [Pelagibacterium luteolum]